MVGLDRTDFGWTDGGRGRSCGHRADRNFGRSGRVVDGALGHGLPLGLTGDEIGYRSLRTEFIFGGVDGAAGSRPIVGIGFLELRHPGIDEGGLGQGGTGQAGIEGRGRNGLVGLGRTDFGWSDVGCPRSRGRRAHCYLGGGGLVIDGVLGDVLTRRLGGLHFWHRCTWCEQVFGRIGWGIGSLCLVRVGLFELGLVGIDKVRFRQVAECLGDECGPGSGGFRGGRGIGGGKDLCDRDPGVAADRFGGINPGGFGGCWERTIGDCSRLGLRHLRTRALRAEEVFRGIRRSLLRLLRSFLQLGRFGSWEGCFGQLVENVGFPHLCCSGQLVRGGHGRGCHEFHGLPGDAGFDRPGLAVLLWFELGKVERAFHFPCGEGRFRIGDLRLLRHALHGQLFLGERIDADLDFRGRRDGIGFQFDRDEPNHHQQEDEQVNRDGRGEALVEQAGDVTPVFEQVDQGDQCGHRE